VLTWEGTYAEIKRVEALNVEQALVQAELALGFAKDKRAPMSTEPIPYVAHRRNRTEWCVTVRAANLVEFCKRLLGGMEP